MSAGVSKGVPSSVHSRANNPRSNEGDLVEIDQLDPEQGVLLDHFTASMLVQIHDALNVANRERFAAMPLVRAVDVGWQLAARAAS